MSLWRMATATMSSLTLCFVRPSKCMELSIKLEALRPKSALACAALRSRAHNHPGDFGLCRRLSSVDCKRGRRKGATSKNVKYRRLKFIQIPSTELESGNALGAFLQTPAPVLDETSGPMDARFLSVLGWGLVPPHRRAHFSPVAALFFF